MGVILKVTLSGALHKRRQECSVTSSRGAKNGGETERGRDGQDLASCAADKAIVKIKRLPDEKREIMGGEREIAWRHSQH